VQAVMAKNSKTLHRAAEGLLERQEELQHHQSEGEVPNSDISDESNERYHGRSCLTGCCVVIGVVAVLLMFFVLVFIVTVAALYWGVSFSG
jgi:Flp pilus assembly protein TadB